MRKRVVCALATAVLAVAPAAAFAAEPQAPPMLTPLVALDVATACPGSAAYAAALVRGITDSEAIAATPVFESCAARATYSATRQIDAVNTALGAVYLSRALLNGNDAALLRRAIDATERLRSLYRVPDEVVRRWPIIPDEYDARRREAIIRLDCPSGTWTTDATYINVAARTGTAWISRPRDAMQCVARGYAATFPNLGWSSNGQSFSGLSGSNPFARPNPAIDPPDITPISNYPH